MNIIFRKLALVSALSATAFLGACTQTDVATSLSAACSLAAIGSQVTIDVAAPGSVGSTVGGLISTEGSKECQPLANAAANLISSYTATGTAATATVVVTAPTGRVSLRRSAKFRRLGTDTNSKIVYSITVQPGGFGSLDKYLPNL